MCRPVWPSSDMPAIQLGGSAACWDCRNTYMYEHFLLSRYQAISHRRLVCNCIMIIALHLQHLLV